MTAQDEATKLLEQWQALRRLGLAPEERLERLMGEFFAPPFPTDAEYEATLRNVAEAIQ